LMVGAPLLRRTTVQQHRHHHQIKTLPRKELVCLPGSDIGTTESNCIL
jgi:hypothetical protein